ncbi:hypothetical protein GE21DRAFT_1735 [Neurospora crassa]|uniref:protein-histidine N-methyltransferase n=1 Tax=Neurospora crassa (strain ATCC 24698 / 74-OR23-1A / CBS 708.71 / DSM 1257 / FGSC 987) TaxID=367110 RepID=Q7SGG6_NEUCR|nr:hypothetical protein NCU00956 [Neurospora crassa OR74A]EAA35913.2 hypothetical protein NCU00956 [Neurospora crassa OR74A]KHE81126.1 hypothetical protein GE21DRAFT_1735 [Neurospora crassa]|eukprot:XP_965149.2 hypothetical protein NCU00956 [Neurospora crassa OR74A]
MASGFSFGFAGDDIEDDGQSTSQVNSIATPTPPAATSASAFPVQGKPLLPPTHHDIDHMLSRLPSKIAYSLLDVELEERKVIQIPRRELWDVRVQLMAEDDGSNISETEPGLGEHDVKTGIYEGGFKSWESSVDLVKVLASENAPTVLNRDPCVLMELGCGTALPSLALFHWAMNERKSGEKQPLTLVLADYNPSVLYLVTLPNFILAWALSQRESTSALADAFSLEDEVELLPGVVEAFKEFLTSNQITLSFLSGGWSPEFVDLLYNSGIPSNPTGNVQTLVIGAETIYSPFALESFAATLLLILERERNERPSGHASSIVGAKKMYFGVGGSLDDFVLRMRGLGASVEPLREEAEGVRRGVVRCYLS